jgi:hypothetical protein
MTPKVAAPPPPPHPMQVTSKVKLNFPSTSMVKFLQLQAAAAGGGLAGTAAASPTPRSGARKAATGAAAPPHAGVAGPQEMRFRGVHATEEGQFKVIVQHKRSQRVVGVYSGAEEAARAYDRESLRINGRGAITNFPLAGQRALQSIRL